MQTIREHIERRFAAAKLSYSPFPHCIVGDFFPDNIYANILKYNLFKYHPGTEWLSRSHSADVTARTPYYARKQINFLRNQNISVEAPNDAIQFWQSIKDCFMSDDWFGNLVYQKYPDFFKIRFGDLTDEDDFLSHFKTEFFLQRHDPGYHIGPHTDIPSRVFTCIFSFAERDGFEEYGTQLLRHKDRLVRCWGFDHYPSDDFTVATVAPYKPNHFLLFFKTRHSFHSVKTITEEVPNQRYGMQFQLYEPRGGLFRDLSMPDLIGGSQKRSVGATVRQLASRVLPHNRV